MPIMMTDNCHHMMSDDSHLVMSNNILQMMTDMTVNNSNITIIEQPPSAPTKGSELGLKWKVMDPILYINLLMGRGFLQGLL